MICLADNDAVFKLAACNLLNEALEVLGLSRDDVYVLNTVKYQLRKGRSLNRLVEKYGVEGLNRALEFVLSVNEIQGEPDIDELHLLSTIEDIDAGEAVLFAATRTLDDFIIITGDKKALKAIGKAAGCTFLRKRLEGRVLCFEQVVALILRTQGLDTIKPGIVSALSCDTALRVAFGSEMDTTLDGALDALDYYVSELRMETGALLIIEVVP